METLEIILDALQEILEALQEILEAPEFSRENLYLIWFSSHLFVPLVAPKVLSLGNTKEKTSFPFVFRSLIRTFAGKF